MVPVINTTGDMMQALNYNEKKVQQKKAVLVHSDNFLKNKEHLTFYDKAERFQKMNDLNPDSKVNMLHVSVNFHPSEKISPELIRDISRKYMAGIGLPNQPYLVYEHFDSGHPHFHILTNMIREDGTRLKTNNLGKNQSRKTADAIEKEYNLIRAKDQKQDRPYSLKPVDIKKIQYGKTEVKKSVQQVLNRILKDYKVGSLPELNAILGQYNVIADRCGPGSRTYQKGGLMFKVLNEAGQPAGVPIKASDFYWKEQQKPTLKNLEKKFEKDKELRNQLIPGIKTRIDWTLLANPNSLDEFKEDLRNEGIELLIRQNKEGVIYGMTYIDFRNKMVANGSEIGKAYSAKGILDRLKLPGVVSPEMEPKKEKKNRDKKSNPPKEPSKGKTDLAAQSVFGDKLEFPQILSGLLAAENISMQLPYELRQQKKKKRRR